MMPNIFVKKFQNNPDDPGNAWKTYRLSSPADCCLSIDVEDDKRVPVDSPDHSEGDSWYCPRCKRIWVLMPEYVPMHDSWTINLHYKDKLFWACSG